MESAAGMMGGAVPSGIAPPLNGNTDFSQMLAGWQMPPPAANPLPQAEMDRNTMLAGWKMPASIGEPVQVAAQISEFPTPTSPGPTLERLPSPSPAPQPPSLPQPRTTPNSIDDMLLSGGPLMVHDGRLSAVPNGWQGSGRISIDGDSVYQKLGGGHKAEYSLSQLSAHAKDPEYFAATLQHAAKYNESVTLGFRNGDTNVKDLALEHSLPQNMPLRDPILRAAVMHDIDPKLLAAVGVQETHLGADYLGQTSAHYHATHRGDVEPDSTGGHGYGPFQYDDQKRFGHPGRPQADLDRAARDPYYAADNAASMLSDNLKQTGGNVKDALHLYNAGNLITPTSTTDWGPQIGNLSYEDSTLRYYGEVASQSNSKEIGHSR